LGTQGVISTLDIHGTSRVSTSRPRLWVGAFTGFYKPGVEEVRSLDAVSRFLYAAHSVILVISAQAVDNPSIFARRSRPIVLAAPT
jgi:1,4-dihydroxy-2-naphthoate octaprenyltransferase